MADEASLALVGAFVDLEDFAAVVRLAARFAKLYPKSTLPRQLPVQRGAGRLPPRPVRPGDRGRRDDRRARSTRTPPAPTSPAPTSGRRVYILGQIYDARRQPARALEYYKQVADRFTDAAGAIQSYTRKDLKVPEVTVVRPEHRPARAADAGRQRGRLPVIDVRPGRIRRRRPPKPGIRLDYRNIAQVDVKVYPVDLMQLYLTRRNLNGIAGIDLAGITPLVEKTVALGSGADFEDKPK